MNKYLRNHFVGIKKGLPNLKHPLLKNLKDAQKHVNCTFYLFFGYYEIVNKCTSIEIYLLTLRGKVGRLFN